MTLKDYYKKQVYEYGYNMGWLDRHKDGITKGDHKDPSRDIFYQDEQDWYICADYYGMYIGDPQAWSEDDKKTLNMLGFEPSDFVGD